MLELPIQGKTALLPVVAEQWGYGVHLAERGTGRYLVTGWWGQENETLGGARLGKGAAPTPIIAPSLFGHRSQGSGFWLNPFKEINSSDTTNCGGNALESGDSLGRIPPSPHILLGLLFSAAELQLFAGRGSIIGSSQGYH